MIKRIGTSDFAVQKMHCCNWVCATASIILSHHHIICRDPAIYICWEVAPDCNRFRQLKHWPRKSIVISVLPSGVSWSTLYNGVDDISIMHPSSLSVTIHVFGQCVCWAGARKLESASAAVTTIDSNGAIAIDVAHNLTKILFVIMWVL